MFNDVENIKWIAAFILYFSNHFMQNKIKGITSNMNSYEFITFALFFPQIFKLFKIGTFTCILRIVLFCFS